MLPTNIAYRTFFIRAALYGTAFTLDVGDSEYLVTAAHLLPEGDGPISIQIYFNKAWLRGSATIVGRGRGEVDIAVLRLETRLSPLGLPVSASTGSLYVGQDVFFVGYPYKMSVDYGELFGGRPGPFLKKGCPRPHQPERRCLTPPRAHVPTAASPGGPAAHVELQGLPQSRTHAAPRHRQHDHQRPGLDIELIADEKS